MFVFADFLAVIHGQNIFCSAARENFLRAEIVDTISHTDLRCIHTALYIYTLTAAEAIYAQGQPHPIWMKIINYV